MIEYSNAPQGSEEWLAARVGYITGSRIRDVRDRLKGGAFSTKATLYAQDIARERCGGQPERPFVTWAMRQGKEAEESAIRAYEDAADCKTFSSGFAFDPETLYGCSPDGLVGDDGMVEVKTLVGSSSLFRVLVEGDYSGFMDQIQFSLHLMECAWCDLVLWAPDFGIVRIVRILPDPVWIALMMADIVAFEEVVNGYQVSLQAALEVGAGQ